MMRIFFSLTPSESKRLIGKGVAVHPLVKEAMKGGVIVVAGGTTNAFVAEELLGLRFPEKGWGTAGFIGKGVPCVTPRGGRFLPLVIERGGRVDKGPAEALTSPLSPRLLLKGANAIDRDGDAGIFVASPTGGTAGRLYGMVAAGTVELLLPVGLEKMVPSVGAIKEKMGRGSFHTSLGAPPGIFVIPRAPLFTEIDAVKALSGAEAFHVGSGGIGGSEGGVHLVAEGEKGEVEALLRIIESVRGEPAVESITADCLACDYDCLWKGKGGGPG